MICGDMCTPLALAPPFHVQLRKWLFLPPSGRQAWRVNHSKLTTLSMSFQVFSTVRRSAAACFGGPTASWMASMMPKILPLLRFGPRPPGFRPLRAVAISYTLRLKKGMIAVSNCCQLLNPYGKEYILDHMFRQCCSVWNLLQCYSCPCSFMDGYFQPFWLVLVVTVCFLQREL